MIDAMEDDEDSEDDRDYGDLWYLLREREGTNFTKKKLSVWKRNIK